MNKNYTPLDRWAFRTYTRKVNTLVAEARRRHGALTDEMARLVHESDLLTAEERDQLHTAKLGIQVNRYRVWLESPAAARYRIQLRTKRRKERRAS